MAGNPEANRSGYMLPLVRGGARLVVTSQQIGKARSEMRYDRRTKAMYDRVASREPIDASGRLILTAQEFAKLGSAPKLEGKPFNLNSRVELTGIVGCLKSDPDPNHRSPRVFDFVDSDGLTQTRVFIPMLIPSEGSQHFQYFDGWSSSVGAPNLAELIRRSEIEVGSPISVTAYPNHYARATLYTGEFMDISYARPTFR